MDRYRDLLAADRKTVAQYADALVHHRPFNWFHALFHNRACALPR